MMRTIRDTLISALVIAILVNGFAVLLFPEAVGRWEARKESGFEEQWGAYVSDCDCGEAVE